MRGCQSGIQYPDFCSDSRRWMRKSVRKKKHRPRRQTSTGNGSDHMTQKKRSGTKSTMLVQQKDPRPLRKGLGGHSPSASSEGKCNKQGRWTWEVTATLQHCAGPFWGCRSPTAPPNSTSCLYSDTPEAGLTLDISLFLKCRGPFHILLSLYLNTLPLPLLQTHPLLVQLQCHVWRHDELVPLRHSLQLCWPARFSPLSVCALQLSGRAALPLLCSEPREEQGGSLLLEPLHSAQPWALGTHRTHV